jgi:hypothetical protein
MFHPVRLFATLLYLASIAATLFTAFYLQEKFAVLGCILLQLMAMLW